MSSKQAWFDETCQKQHLVLPGSYLKTLLRTADWLAEGIKEKKDGKFFLSISGAQGSGKSTFALLLAGLLESRFDYSALVLSLDDFYLTREQRLDLARSVHPLLSTRGVPGTHDVSLLASVIEDIKQGKSTRLPRFSKAEDDRTDQAEIVTDSIDIIICEGWCWGTKPVPEKELSVAVNELEAIEDPNGIWRSYINDQLIQYQQIFKTDRSIFMAVPDMEVVLNWRWQQEQQLAAGIRVMNFDDMRRFIMFYERITRNMLQEMPDQVDLILRLGSDHEFIE